MRDSESKRHERHIKKKKVRRRHNLRLLVIVLGVILLFYGMIRLYNSPIFDIRQIEVVGNRQVARAELIKLAKIQPGQNLLRAPVREAERRIESNPWVERATVKRLLPAKLRLDVVERVPVATVLFNDGAAVVDKSSYVVATVKDPTSSQYKRLPRIETDLKALPKVGRRTRNERIEDAVTILVGLTPAVRERVRSMVLGGPEELKFYLRSEIEILFGSIREREQKYRVLEQILHDYARQRKIPLYIDVRTPRSPVTKDLPQPE